MAAKTRKPVNPFKPTAGRMPPMLIGRNDIIEDFEEGLDNGSGKVDFAIPYLREYLREHAAYFRMSSDQ